MHSEQLRSLRDVARLKVLADTELMDSAIDDRFDRHTRRASKLLGVPIALLSLVDAQRQFFKSLVGRAAPCAAPRGSPLSQSLCQHVVTSGRPLSIEDAESHPLVSGDVDLSGLGVAAYLGVPVLVDGAVLGALCAIDTRARPWSERDVELLESVAEAVVLEIELGLAQRELRIASRDASDREASLRETEEELRLTIQHAPIGIALVAPDGRFVRVNDALCGIVGYTRDELLQRSVPSVSHPDDMGPELALARQLLRGERASYAVEKRYYHRDGRTLWAHASVSLVRDAAGHPRFFISQIEDITARRDAEVEARMFFEHSLDLLAIANVSGRFEKVNGAWERTLGWSRTLLASRPYLEFVHLDDIDSTRRETEALYTGSGTHSFVNRYRAKDGSYHWLDWRCYLAEPGKAFCVARDISSEVEREQQLRLFQRALVAAQNGVIMTNPRTAHNPIIYVNPAFERMTGYAADELIGQGAGFLFGPEAHQPEVDQMREAIRDGRDCQVVVRSYKKSGESFLTKLAISPVRDAKGRLTQYVGIAEDITARVEAEQAIVKQSAIMRAVLDNMSEGVLVADPNGKIILSNPAMQTMMGIIPSDVQGDWSTTYGIFLPDRVTPCPPDQVPTVRALRGERVEDEEFWLRVPGSSEGRWHSVSASPVRDQSGNLLGAVRVGRDITVRKSMEQDIQRAALTDELTGLHNRRGFMLMGEQMLRLAQRHAQPLHLLFIDLNDMKGINDRLGHDVGDEALVATARIMQTVFRSADILARLGGDEFVVLAEGDAAAAPVLRARLLSAVAAFGDRPDARFRLSLSVGLTRYDADHPIALTQLLAEADRAMYESKRRSKSDPDASTS